MINETIWSGSFFETASTDPTTEKTGYVYNRYDDMQGKWGITLDKNASYVEFDVNGNDTNGKPHNKINLSDTPYLTYSTEHEDGVKLSIAVQISMPTAWDSETGAATAWDDPRWYTITDNNLRPEIEEFNDAGEVTKSRIMDPEVQISAVDGDPITNAQAYVDGATTGCIDMVYWLPYVNPTPAGDESDMFRVDKVRIYKDGDKPARVNYLYFMNQAGPILSPMSFTAGVDLSADKEVKSDEATTLVKNKSLAATADDYNGWRNGAAWKTCCVTNSGYGGDIDTSVSGLQTYEHKNKDYVTIVVPVRKWANVASGARRLTFTIGGCKNEEGPVFAIYGNSIGFSDPDEDSTGVSVSDYLLAVIGGKGGTTADSSVPYTSPYKATTGYAEPGDIDADFAYHLDYTAKSNWFDLLDSGYIRKRMVQSGDKAGWVYISEVHMTVPTGVTYNIGQLNMGPASDSLNESNKSGAFDGGTGVYPNVDVSNGQTVTNKAAAFGPLLDTSNFGTFDMLRRVSSETGEQGYYGRVFRNQSGNAIKGQWSPPNANDATDAQGNVISIPGYYYFTAYAKCTCKGNPYLLVASNDSSRRVWIPWTESVVERSSVGLLHDAGEVPTWDNSTSGNIVKQFAADNWLLSPFGDGSKSAGTVSTATDGYPISGLNGGWDTEQYNHGSVGFANDSYVGWGHGDNKELWQTSDTAMGFAFPADYNGTTRARAGSFARTFSQPLVLKKQNKDDGYAGTAPVLRYGFVASSIGSQFKIALILDIGGTKSYYFICPDSDGKVVVSNTITANAFKPEHNDKYFTGHFSFEDILTANSGKTVKLVGMATYANQGAFVTFKNMEVLYERDDKAWYDELNLTADGEVADSIDIISDAFHYTIASGKDSFEDRISSYGEKGWKIADYDLDGNAASGSLHSVASGSPQYPTYRPSLDHLRMPVASGDTGWFKFQADRSFPISLFKYLYVSYSVADDDGVAAADDEGTGMSIELRTVQDINKGYYMHVDDSGEPVGFQYAKSIPQEFSPNVNAAVDLSTLSGITSINEVVFRMKNTTPATVNFYVNYLFLSNVPPAEFYEEVTETPYYHNYYLMDASGDRYSCRFPTTSNPTGRISSSVAGTENSRVNPL
ncbi:MAG: hypothetical protein IJC52_05185, partial [Clostridia bacterium]|nr:hypothetical protein [Clostridia bacterium]